jgi:hypothetical protein
MQFDDVDDIIQEHADYASMQPPELIDGGGYDPPEPETAEYVAERMADSLQHMIMLGDRHRDGPPPPPEQKNRLSLTLETAAEMCEKLLLPRHRVRYHSALQAVQCAALCSSVDSAFPDQLWGGTAQRPNEMDVLCRSVVKRFQQAIQEVEQKANKTLPADGTSISMLYHEYQDAGAVEQAIAATVATFERIHNSRCERPIKVIDAALEPLALQEVEPNAATPYGTIEALTHANVPRRAVPLNTINGWGTNPLRDVRIPEARIHEPSPHAKPMRRDALSLRAELYQTLIDYHYLSKVSSNVRCIVGAASKIAEQYINDAGPRPDYGMWPQPTVMRPHDDWRIQCLRRQGVGVNKQQNAPWLNYLVSQRPELEYSEHIGLLRISEKYFQILQRHLVAPTNPLPQEWATMHAKIASAPIVAVQNTLKLASQQRAVLGGLIDNAVALAQWDDENEGGVVEHTCLSHFDPQEHYETLLLAAELCGNMIQVRHRASTLAGLAVRSEGGCIPPIDGNQIEAHKEGIHGPIIDYKIQEKAYDLMDKADAVCIDLLLLHDKQYRRMKDATLGCLWTEVLNNTLQHSTWLAMQSRPALVPAWQYMLLGSEAGRAALLCMHVLAQEADTVRPVTTAGSAFAWLASTHANQMPSMWRPITGAWPVAGDPWEMQTPPSVVKEAMPVEMHLWKNTIPSLVHPLTATLWCAAISMIMPPELLATLFGWKSNAEPWGLSTSLMPAPTHKLEELELIPAGEVARWMKDSAE